jgi:hypothetical protein
MRSHGLARSLHTAPSVGLADQPYLDLNVDEMIAMARA